MSKVGKKPITIPSDVTVSVNGGTLSFKGPKGSLSHVVKSPIKAVLGDSFITIEIENQKELQAKNSKEVRALWGLERALVANAITGVHEGFQKVLEFEGVGYRATVKGSDLELSLGYSHPIVVTAPENVAFKVEKSTITITGPDREAIGHVAAEIRSHRLPEPYRGSGIRYRGEVIIRKAGKKAASSA